MALLTITQLRGIGIDVGRRAYTEVGMGILMLPCSAFLDAVMALTRGLAWVVGHAAAVFTVPLLRR